MATLVATATPAASTATVTAVYHDIEQGLPHSTYVSPRSSTDIEEEEEELSCGGREKGVQQEQGRRSCVSLLSSSCGEDDNDDDDDESECCSVVDLEIGGNSENEVVVKEKNNDNNVHLVVKVERDCRICHLSLDGSNPESGFPIELGCSCKEDLAAAHRHCAEAWFKIRGNKTCEICGSTAKNVVGVNEVELMDQWNDANDVTAAMTTVPPHHPSETRHFWQGHRFLNFLLACMVFAFVISWLFHFNVPS